MCKIYQIIFTSADNSEDNFFKILLKIKSNLVTITKKKLQQQ